MSGIESLKEALGDKYEIDRELGRGGMATVYLATDRKLARKVAIKVLLPDLAAAVGAERFRREIQIVTQLNHPHILALYDWGDANGLMYYVMPFVQGESLRAYLNRTPQLPIDEAVRITAQVATALDYAHAQGIFHRDIKPENLLIESGQVIIADFGIARVVGDASNAPALTQTGVSIGTPTYMSPEQGLADKQLDGRADQYSLACVLYEMLAGHPPFSGGSLQSLIMRHTVEQVPPLRIVRRTVSMELEDVIMHALAKSPADRFESCAKFAEALLSPAGFTSSWRISNTQGGLTNIPPAPRPVSNRWLFAGGALVATMLIALVGWKTMWPQNGKIIQAGVPAGYTKDRVAVQYFQDISDKKAFAELTAGLTEGLIEQLSRVEDLDVVSKNGVSQYRDSVMSADRFGKTFSAPWVVQGSVDQDGRDVRVTIKLVDGVSGAALETETVKQAADSALALRQQLVVKAADLLKQRIGREITLNTQRNEAHNNEAWLLTQRADKLRRDGDAAAADKQNAAALSAYASADSLLAAAARLDREWLEPAIQRSFLAYRSARATDSKQPKERMRFYQKAIALADSIIGPDTSTANRDLAPAFQYRGTARFYAYYDHLYTDQREAAAAFKAALADVDKSTKLNKRNASAWMTLSTIYANVPDLPMSRLMAGNAWEVDKFGLQAASILDRLYRTSYITRAFNEAQEKCDLGRSRFPRDHRFVECTLWTYTIPDRQLSAASLDSVWMFTDTIQALAPANLKEFYRRQGHVVAAIVLGKIGKADSARRVLSRIEDTPREADPTGDLLFYNAYARETLGDRKKAIDLLKIYLIRNPEHRDGWGKDATWWWDELKNDPDFKRLIATGI